MKARNRRIKIEKMKAKVALAIMFTAGALGDSGIAFLIVALFGCIWLAVCMRRMERLGA